MILNSVTPSKGELVDKTFLFPVRVYYEDTDAGGIVYYANYLKFAERCRTEFLRSLGVNQQDGLEQQEKTGWVVRHCEIEYLKSAVLDDVLTVSCRIVNLGGVTAQMHQEILRGSEILATIEVKLAHLSLITKKPVRISKDLMQNFI
ncbi:MAG: tol-pal system-associated acyl-CoA thioesterase [Alphaproteobacteria bacterium]|nr:tol-pal system-associated acyl-CoA thioesterase [Alphaproteobacteria bacterium]